MQFTYDHRCDVYSFGILLWEVMHEKVPFGDLGGMETVRCASRGQRPEMALGDERARFASIIELCWSQNPNHRPALTEVAQTFLQLEKLGWA